MSRLAPLSCFSPSFDSSGPELSAYAASPWRQRNARSSLHYPPSTSSARNNRADVADERGRGGGVPRNNRGGGVKEERQRREQARCFLPEGRLEGGEGGGSLQEKEEDRERTGGSQRDEEERGDPEKSLRCLRSGTEEELQVLAARVLRRLPSYPQMLSIEEISREMIKLDVNVVSKGLIYMSRGLPKALSSSRLLFVGSKDACQREVRAEEQRREREQEQEEEERRRKRHELTRRQRGREGRRGGHERKMREVQEGGMRQKEPEGGREEEEESRETGREEEKPSSPSDPSCRHTASSGSGTPTEEEEEEGTEEEEEDDQIEWFNTPLRDEQASCYPWLLPSAPQRSDDDRDTLLHNTSPPEAARSSLPSSSSSSSPAREEGGEEAADLFVLLRPYVSPVDEVFGRGDLLVVLCSFLDVKDVVHVGRVCRGAVEASLSDQVWLSLLKRKFPQASLVHEDVLESADLQTQLDAEQQKDIIDALLVQIPPDSPASLSNLLLIANRILNEKLASKPGRQASSWQGGRGQALKIDLESLLHLLSGHPRLFKQDASGEQIVVSPSLVYEDWLCVNPYALLRGEGVNGGIEDPEKKKKEIEEQVSAELAREQQEEAKEEEEEEGEDDTPSLLKREDAFLSEKERGQLSVSSFNQEQGGQRFHYRRDLTPRQAYRLWSTQLLGRDQNKQRPWEYHSESNTRGTLPAGHLLDLCENRVRFIRRGDPTAVHTLTVRTLEGIAFHIRTGCYNRRVNILQQALCSTHLRLERDVRKRFERRLLELMRHVKEERKFGFYQCKGCSARWRSGFTYDEIRQQCLRCYLWNKPFKLQPLLTSSASPLLASPTTPSPASSSSFPPPSSSFSSSSVAQSSSSQSGLRPRDTRGSEKTLSRMNNNRSSGYDHHENNRHTRPQFVPGRSSSSFSSSSAVSSQSHFPRDSRRVPDASCSQRTEASRREGGAGSSDPPTSLAPWVAGLDSLKAGAPGMRRRGGDADSRVSTNDHSTREKKGMNFFSRAPRPPPRGRGGKSERTRRREGGHSQRRDPHCYPVESASGSSSTSTRDALSSSALPGAAILHDKKESWNDDRPQEARRLVYIVEGRNERIARGGCNRAEAEWTDKDQTCQSHGGGSSQPEEEEREGPTTKTFDKRHAEIPFGPDQQDLKTPQEKEEEREGSVRQSYFRHGVSGSLYTAALSQICPPGGTGCHLRGQMWMRGGRRTRRRGGAAGGFGERRDEERRRALLERNQVEERKENNPAARRDLSEASRQPQREEEEKEDTPSAPLLSTPTSQTISRKTGDQNFVFNQHHHCKDLQRQIYTSSTTRKTALLPSLSHSRQDRSEQFPFSFQGTAPEPLWEERGGEEEEGTGRKEPIRRQDHSERRTTHQRGEGGRQPPDPSSSSSCGSVIPPPPLVPLMPRNLPLPHGQKEVTGRSSRGHGGGRRGEGGRRGRRDSLRS